MRLIKTFLTIVLISSIISKFCDIISLTLHIKADAHGGENTKPYLGWK